jgi:hypothetical protein
MQTVLIDVTDELNRLVAVAQLAPTTHLDVIEKFALDMIQATRELKSATEAYAAFVIRLSEKPRPGDASA